MFQTTNQYHILQSFSDMTQGDYKKLRMLINNDPTKKLAMSDLFTLAYPKIAGEWMLIPFYTSPTWE